MASPYFLVLGDRRLLFIITACEKLAERIAVIQREKEGKEYRAKRISLFMRMENVWRGYRENKNIY